MATFLVGEWYRLDFLRNFRTVAYSVFSGVGSILQIRMKKARLRLINE